MKTLDRYVAIIFLKNLAISLMALTLIYVFQSLLAELLDHEFPLRQILAHTIMNIPEVAVQMTPPSVLIANVLTLSGLNRSNELVAAFSLGIGLKRLVAFHLNDSKKPLNSRVDRHEHIGKGQIGLATFRRLLRDRRFFGLPMCLETPKGPDLKEDIENLATLRKLLAGC